MKSASMPETRSIFLWPLLLLIMAGCTSTTVNEHRATLKPLQLAGKEQVVVLGRRHAGQYETEPDFIDCIGGKLARTERLQVVDEQRFLNDLYPWFEPRTAPLRMGRLEALMEEPLVADRIRSMGVRYMIWVDGNTETSESDGSISCAIGPGGGGCFGFATWEKISDYEAVVWDVKQLTDMGRVRVDAKGSSYLFGVVAPVPIIARVQGQACDGIGNQLRSFFAGDSLAASQP